MSLLLKVLGPKGHHNETVVIAHKNKLDWTQILKTLITQQYEEEMNMNE